MSDWLYVLVIWISPVLMFGMGVFCENRRLTLKERNKPKPKYYS